MKNPLHNISIFAILVLFNGSCSDDGKQSANAEVRFTATIPTDTRSFGQAGNVNTLVVGVFSKTGEHAENKSRNYYEVLRKSFPISGTTVGVELTLAREQTYSFVFWAYDARQNIYNTDNLTAIVMNALPDSVTFSMSESADAFFMTKEDVTIKGNCNYPVELVRPLAQINVGTTGIPAQASFKAKSAPDTFHPFTNSVSGKTDFTWNFSETTPHTFQADGVEYNYLAIGYIFAPATATKITAELTLTDVEQKSTTVEFQEVEIRANQKSNIAGALFTTK